MEKKREALWSKGRYDETGHARMAKPKPGEWLWSFVEDGQDEDDYRKECANRRSKKREKVYVQELGTLAKRAQAVQPAVREWLAAFFGLEVVKRDPEALPKKAWLAAREQWDGDAILAALKKTVPDDALVSVGILDEDLFADDLNFIFGQGSLSERVGVYSFVRLRDADEALYRKRCFRLVAHEVGHILSIEHCVYYECVMNGANSLDEDDGKPLHLCPVCHAKLQWNVGFDDLAREKKLAAILEREKIEDEAKWSRERIGRLEKKTK